MTPRRFIDTNVLLYSISRDRREAGKRTRAMEMLSSGDVALSVQVLQEFYAQATRSSRPDALPHDVAAGFVRAWTRFPVQEITVDVMMTAMEIQARWGFSYWDSAIVAAAQTLGCSEVLSEDMSHGQRVGRVTIVNPFRRP